MITDETTATEQDLSQLRTRGFFVRERFFSEAQIVAFEADTDLAVQRGQGANDGISKPGRIAFVNSGMDYSKMDPRLLKFSTQPRVAQLARSVAGADATFFSYQVVYKFGNNPDPFPWHQDDSYTKSSHGYFTIWVAISDATIDNGCLWVHPGRSLDRIAPCQRTELGNVCWPMDNPDQGIPVELSRGSAVVFTSMLMHKSGGNQTPHTRKGHIITFLDRHTLIGGKEHPFLAFP
jgi:ectoine hydroxylase-related dioxygenase (phytanoyl-CoA dioxygenase family)